MVIRTHFARGSTRTRRFGVFRCVQNGAASTQCLTYRVDSLSFIVRCHHQANRKIIRWMPRMCIVTANTIFFSAVVIVRAAAYRSCVRQIVIQFCTTFLIKRDASWSRDGISLYGNVNFEIIFFLFVPLRVAGAPVFFSSLAFQLTRWHEQGKWYFCVRTEEWREKRQRQQQQAVLQSN